MAVRRRPVTQLYSLWQTKNLCHGAYPAISLKKARVQRDKAKALVADGIDPVQYRAASKSRQAEAAANIVFRMIHKNFVIGNQRLIDFISNLLKSSMGLTV